ncbi:MAG: cytochrome c biogenesis protein CcsA [Terriglobia bacterium]
MKSMRWLGLLTFLSVLVALYAIFIYAPIEASMLEVQKIFYFHASAGWISFLAIFCVLVYSILFLAKRTRNYDLKASAAAEVGTIFATIVMVTGPLWAKPVWGVWWAWDARLTSMFVLWLIYLGYLMLRRLIEAPEQKARFSAIFGILGAIDVPIVYMSNRWWRTQHPSPVMAGGQGSGLDPQMKIAFFISLGAFTLLYLYLWKLRSDLELSKESVEALQRQVEIETGRNR